MKIVFTNGCFDILHAGHVDFLKRVKQYGDVLIVGLNTDNSVRLLKGNNRPINTFSNRKLVLESIYYVNQVVGFDELTPYNLIKTIRPDILIKGGDYESINQIIGHDIVKETYILPFKIKTSTTSIIQQIKNQREDETPL